MCTLLYIFTTTHQQTEGQEECMCVGGVWGLRLGPSCGLWAISVETARVTFSWEEPFQTAKGIRSLLLCMLSFQIRLLLFSSLHWEVVADKKKVVSCIQVWTFYSDSRAFKKKKKKKDLTKIHQCGVMRWLAPGAAAPAWEEREQLGGDDVEASERRCGSLERCGFQSHLWGLSTREQLSLISICSGVDVDLVSPPFFLFVFYRHHL